MLVSSRCKFTGRSAYMRFHHVASFPFSAGRGRGECDKCSDTDIRKIYSRFSNALATPYLPGSSQTLLLRNGSFKKSGQSHFTLAIYVYFILTILRLTAQGNLSASVENRINTIHTEKYVKRYIFFDGRYNIFNIYIYFFYTFLFFINALVSTDKKTRTKIIRRFLYHHY